jgi:hypothetical protein
MECPICYETIGEKNCCVTECGHSFCFKCVTKALTMNNACPCCRAQLLEEEEIDEGEEEDDEDSEYDEEYIDDGESDAEDDEDQSEEERRVAQLLTIQEFKQNMGVIHDRLLSENYSSEDLMKIIMICMYGYVSEELHNEFNELADKMTISLNKIIPDLHKELREREREQQMFTKEDNIDKIINTYNGLELINHFYM